MVQVSSTGILPSRKFSCVIITNASHLILYGFFSRVDYLSHIFGYSSRIPDGPPDLPQWIPRTAAVISSSLGGPSGTTSGWTSNRMGPPSGSCLL